MQCFFVHFKCELGRAYEVAGALADTDLASEVFSISGDWDLLAKFYLNPDIDIGRFVNANLHKIDGIERTLTTLTFKAF